MASKPRPLDGYFQNHNGSGTSVAANNNQNLALVEKHNEKHIDSQLLAYKKINTKEKITLTHQFFTLSLLEYICNFLNPKDPQSAHSQFQGKFFCCCCCCLYLKFILKIDSSSINSKFLFLKKHLKHKKKMRNDYIKKRI